MKLKLENIGIIHNAEIEIDSISILTGINGSGKSTIGKTFYSMATALNIMDETSLNFNRYESILRELNIFRRYINTNNQYEVYEELTQYISMYQRNLREYKYLISSDDYYIEPQNTKAIETQLDNIIDEIMSKYFLILENMDKEDMKYFRYKDRIEKINEKRELKSDSNIIKEKIVIEMLQEEFSNNLVSNFPGIKTSKIEFSDKKENEIRVFIKNGETPEVNIRLTNIYTNSFYIDNPFVLDYRNALFSGRPLGMSYRGMDVIKEKGHNEQLLRSLMKDNRFDEVNYFEEVFLDKAIKDIFSSVLKGNIKSNGKDFEFYGENMENPIALENMSSGLKSFSILYLLLKKGLLSNCDLLILDEPETNLHPEWQLKLANLIVMLSEEFQIKILIASHSPYFIEAIELYSLKYNKSNQIRYYSSEINEKGMVNINQVLNSELIKVYDQLYGPLSELEKIRYEVNKEGY